MFNFPSSHYEILADVISHKYRSAIIPKYSRKRFENRLFVCDSNISCAGKVSFYSITENDHSDSYGRECLTELTKALEDYRDDLVVIVAGYTAPMKDFFNANPGLKSRFNTFIEFPDYSAEELEKILLSICQKNDYLLDESAQHITSEFFEQRIAKKNANFSNGRFARNIYDDLVMNHARRVVHLEKPTRKDLCTIIAEDFHQDCESVEQFD